jgi:prepilin-type N-terminal cleavage/methylation domain-containing protein
MRTRTALPLRSKSAVLTRRGLSLLEVILAIAILGLSIVALGQLVRLGSQAAVDAQNLNQAQVLCESKMSEISAGLLPRQSSSLAAIESASDWQYSVVVSTSDLPGLLLVEVAVQQDPSQFTRPMKFSLVRFMVDPDYQPDAEAAE